MAVALAVCVFAVVVIALLGWLAYDIERQRRIAARQEGRVLAALRAAAPVAKDARTAVPKLAGGLLRADRLVAGLAGQDAPGAIAAAGELARSLQRADSAGAIEDTGRLARALTGSGRLRPLLADADRLLARANRADLVGDVATTRRLTGELRRLAAHIDSLVATAVPTLQTSLAIQQETRDLLRQSLAVQQEALVHTRNLDRRIAILLPATGPAR